MSNPEIIKNRFFMIFQGTLALMCEGGSSHVLRRSLYVVSRLIKDVRGTFEGPDQAPAMVGP